MSKPKRLTPQRPAARPAPRKQPAPKKRGDALAQLEAAELVRRANEADLTYIFKHALTQESAYQSLLSKHRRQIHQNVARVYESLYANRLDEHAALLARHYAEAGDERKSLEYEIRAGDAATRVYANAEAIEHYTRALNLATKLESDPGTFIHIFTQRGRVYEHLGQYERALANYGEMELIGRERGNRAMEMNALVLRAKNQAAPSSVHNPAQAQIALDQALALARELGDRAAQARILWILMLQRRWTHRSREGVVFGEESLAIARADNLREQMAYTLNDLGIHGYMDSRQLLKAIRALEEVRPLWRELNNLPMLADSYGGSAIVNYLLGEYDRVIEASDEAWRISDSIDNPWGKSYSRWIVGDVYMERGEPARAIQTMEECIQFGEQAGFLGAEVGVRNSLAMALGHLGLYRRANQVVSAALEKTETRLVAWAPWSHMVRARLSLRAGDLSAAEQEFAVVEAGVPQEYLDRYFALLSFHIAMTEGEIALAKKDFRRARVTMDALIEYLRRVRTHSQLPEAYLLRARAEDQPDAAHAALTQAREVGEALAARRTLWQIYALLAEIESRRGNAEAAQGFREQARAVVDYIAAHANEEQRAAFLGMEAVRAIIAT